MVAVMPYEFETQLSIGQQYEAELDAYFSNFFTVLDVPLAVQKLGIDRVHVRNRHPKRRTTVEYKTDIKAGDTGFFFIEILSNSKTGAAGWAWTSTAQEIVFYVPKFKRAGVVSTLSLRAKIYEWQEKYRTVQCQNADYYSKGVLVPWQEIGDLAYRRFTVTPNPSESSRGRNPVTQIVELGDTTDDS